MTVGHIISALEAFAPPALQESYDNCGLILGSALDECTGALLTVDCTEAVVDEAAARGCNLIIAHHPLIFKGIRRINGRSDQERAILKAIRGNIAVYACHTSMDSAPGGVSQRMAKMLGLDAIGPLEPPQGKLLKLTVYVPEAAADELRLALADAGAGEIGNYDFCSYTVKGEGRFRAKSGANPYVGVIGEIHKEREECINAVLPIWQRGAVEQAIRQVHPYEEPAYEFLTLDNAPAMTGLGAVGNLAPVLTPAELIARVKTTFGSPVARCTAYPSDSPIRRVAVCGGSGASLIRRAVSAGAQAIVTSDVKYHDFVDYAGDILIIDIGHHESENCTKSIFFDIISEKFPKFALWYAKADINPINYL